jgi:tripartite-type tricarboxylate transporter receptor subunit TctC
MNSAHHDPEGIALAAAPRCRYLAWLLLRTSSNQGLQPMTPRRSLLAAATLAVTPAARAQSEWRPSRPIRVLVPFAPGGATDLLTRLVASAVGDSLGQPLIVENRPGASGVIATQALFGAPPDGHTIMMATADTNSMLPAANARLPYAVAELVPVSGVANVVFSLIARPGLPIATLPEFVAHARASRTPLSYASFGYGSSAHIAGEVLRAAIGAEMTHVPFPGAGPGITAIAADQVDVMLLPVAVSNPQRSRLKLLGVASEQRFALVPDVPTLTEQGVPVVVDTWMGLVAPPRTAASVAEALHAAVSRVQQRPAFQETLRSNGFLSLDLPPGAFAGFLAREAARWTAAVRAANIRIES